MTCITEFRKEQKQKQNKAHNYARKSITTYSMLMCGLVYSLFVQVCIPVKPPPNKFPNFKKNNLTCKTN